MTSPLDEHRAHMASCLARRRRVENPTLEPMPIVACMAVAPHEDLECHFEYGHGGPHSWEKENER